MLKTKTIEELIENTEDSLSLCIAAEEQDPDFTIIRELIEQLMDELESLDDE